MSVTFTVETGAGIAGANSYVTVAYADDYISVKPTAADWIAQETADKQSYLMLATRLLDAYGVYNGTKSYSGSQYLRFPRMYLTDADGEHIADDEIPSQLKDATVETAFYLYQNGDVSASPSGGAIKRIKAAVIELEYADAPAQSTSPFPAGINQLLLGIGSVAGGGGSRAVAINRA